jgi:PIN domain nuclease of toxin-antitoxin system
VIVLDTHTLLWMDGNDAALGVLTRRQIEIAGGPKVLR